MRNLLSKLGTFALAAALGLGSSGCIKRVLLEGQMKSTKQGANAVSTVSDYEVGRVAALGGLAQFEGMHYLGPDIEVGLVMLTRGWAGAGFGFIEDEMEQAEDLHGEDSELAKYHKARAIAAYSRAVYYGTKLLDTWNPGFEEARKKSSDMKTWLKGFTDKERDTEMLFWTGQAWLSRTNLQKDDPLVVADLFIGVHMIERALELDETFNYGSAHTIMGAYHARSALAKNELPLSKQHFDRALEISNGNALLTKYNMGVKYFCAMGDKESYVKLLTEVVEAGDVLPEQRLQNTIAKRRARRYLAKSRMSRCAF